MKKESFDLDNCDQLDPFFEPDLYGELGAITEHDQCFGKRVEDRQEQDLDEWLEEQL